MSKYILCVDTSSKDGSLAVFEQTVDGLKLKVKTVWEKAKSHSEVITTHCVQLLKRSDLSLPQIKAIVVTSGPGSFTGIRVGLNFAKTLAYSLNIPIYTFDSLLATAYQYKLSELPLVVINNAHKNMVYCAIYTQLNYTNILPACALTLPELETNLIEKEYICIGDAFPVYEKVMNSSLKNKLNYQNPSRFCSLAQTLGEIFYLHKKTARPMSWKQVVPLYIRSSEAEEKLWSGLLKPPLKQ